jgi:hypothetical protein
MYNKTLVLGLAIILCGCSASLSPSQLQPPAAALLVAPKPLPDVKAGDDLVQEHIKLRRMYSMEADRRARLVRYVKTVLSR